MFMVKYKQRNIQKHIVIALALILLVVCVIDVQFYLEYQIVTNTVTGIKRLNQQVNLFDMSIEELMEVKVISKS